MAPGKAGIKTLPLSLLSSLSPVSLEPGVAHSRQQRCDLALVKCTRFWQHYFAWAMILEVAVVVVDLFSKIWESGAATSGQVGHRFRVKGVKGG